MRLNKYIALATGMSRRSADIAIKSGQVTINQKLAGLGDRVSSNDIVALNDRQLKQDDAFTTIMFNKPVGYVCSRKGQGSKTIYDLLPKKYHRLKPVGRLDKESSGLLLLTNDGNLANQLTHPKYQKEKVYIVTLNKTLALSDNKALLTGVRLNDGMSKFIKLDDYSHNKYEVVLGEGRNRQIRRTLNALGYKITHLNRTKFGTYTLDDLRVGKFKEITITK